MQISQENDYRWSEYQTMPGTTNQESTHLTLVQRKIHIMGKEKNKDLPWPYKNLLTDISFLPANEGKLWLKRGDECYKASFLEEGESFLSLCSAINTNLAFAITTKHDRVGKRLLKIELPNMGDALDHFKITELIDTDKEYVRYIDLYDESKLGPLNALDKETSNFLKENSRPRFSLLNIYDVSPDGNFILLNRGDVELIKVNQSGEPVRITTDYSGEPVSIVANKSEKSARLATNMSYGPWIFDVQNRKFQKIQWE